MRLSLIVLLVSVLGHLLVCPYTKVEESFNMQAAHDLIHHNRHLHKYDHHEFPGVVPRTFLGAIAAAVPAAPFTLAAEFAGLPKFVGQLYVRAVLGLLCCFGFSRLADAVEGRLGRRTADQLLLITAVQFHMPFYMSRPLPNTFALVLVLLGYAAWVRGRGWNSFIIPFTFATVVLRAELVVLLGSIMLLELVAGRISFVKMLGTGIPIGVIALGLTVAVDSWFWQKWLWPEGEVLYFNTVQNQSGKWGTLPFFWYFYSAIPKAMTFSLPLVLIGFIVSPTVRKLIYPIILFVLLYSLLPHKELRFILYVFPVLNVVAAQGAAYLWDIKGSKLFRGFSKLVVVGILVASAAASGGFLYVSHLNYPGGEAFAKLHTIMAKAPTSPCSVHIAVPAAQTGVSRFGELNSDCTYSKVESWTAQTKPSDFTWLITDQDGAKDLSETHEVVHVAEGFERLRLSKTPPFVRITTKPKLYVLQNDLTSEADTDG